jgi:hypothetical protein
VHFHIVANAGGDALISTFSKNGEGKYFNFSIVANSGGDALISTFLTTDKAMCQFLHFPRTFHYSAGIRRIPGIPAELTGFRPEF